MKSDIMAIAAHPDDVELAASGTVLKHISLGKTCGIIDLTQGQLGSRGTPELRLEEAEASSKSMGLHFRENLAMEDGWFRADKNHIMMVAGMIRKYRPEVILANAVRDRHPDHGRAADLVNEAVFFSGLIKADNPGVQLPPWRPKLVLNYVQDRYIQPDVVIDITPFIDGKMEAIMAFGSQFYDPESKEPETPISSKEFMEYVRGRAREMGRLIGVEFGEGFTSRRGIGVGDLTTLF